MTRIVGRYHDVEYTVVEYPNGRVECSSAIVNLLKNPDGSMPNRDDLVEACRDIFGDTLFVEEV